jgi:hypothetical protein
VCDISHDEHQEMLLRRIQNNATNQNSIRGFFVAFIDDPDIYWRFHFTVRWFGAFIACLFLFSLQNLIQISLITQ